MLEVTSRRPFAQALKMPVITQKYGYEFPTSDPLKIELSMIREGENLLFHFLEARKYLWPDRYEHRWTRLIYDEILKNEVTVLMGAGSTGKTSTAAEYILIDYWCHSENTLAILSTTTIEKLETAIFGEIKMLFKDARKKYPWLAGNLIDHKHCIATDDLAEDEVRDLRRGILGKALYVGQNFVGLGVTAGTKQERIRFVADELQFCWVKGTRIDTPTGARPIEDIQIGDLVISCCGASRVRKTFTRLASRLVSITTRDGRRIVCTPNHKLLTQKGWLKAVDLNEQHYMLSPHEAMRLVQKDTCWSRSEAFLQSCLCSEMEGPQSRIQKEILQCCVEDKAFLFQEGMVEETNRIKVENGQTDEKSQSNAQSEKLPESSRWDSGFGGLSESARREWHWTNKVRMAVNENVSRRHLELSCKDRKKEREWISPTLQSGFSIARIQSGYRSRWTMPQQPIQAVQGQKEEPVFEGSWVDHIEVLEPGDIGFSEAGGNHQGCRVFNLEVEGHPSYGVNGLLSHNCAPTFLGCLPNMFQNPDVKVIPSGNPRHDPDDQLGIAAEPESGWSSIGEPQKTTVWPLRGFNGVCVNLVGTDSPNFDTPKGKTIPYPRLINWKTVERVEKRWGKNSPEYYSQCKGVMKIGMAHQKVITRELCRQHKAHDEAVWMNETRTKIYGVDPAYGGGDRCIGICVEFGKDKDGQTILKVHTPHNIVIDLTDPRIPEEQIADSVFDHLVALGIPPGNCFYDAFGKGTIGFAFARKFGTNSPVPVDSGARPTKRPVRHDLYIFDEVKRIKRLQRCDEYYSKFVSELWFSVRYAIESEQIRELPEDVMLDGCTREYRTVAGNKIEIETKDDLKERIGRSPDLFDALAVSCEGARQKGFEILRLGPETSDEDDENPLDSLSETWQKTIERKRLNYAR